MRRRLVVTADRFLADSKTSTVCGSRLDDLPRPYTNGRAQVTVRFESATCILR
jgi:hypothetical protein